MEQLITYFSKLGVATDAAAQLAAKLMPRPGQTEDEMAMRRYLADKVYKRGLQDPLLDQVVGNYVRQQPEELAKARAYWDQLNAVSAPKTDAERADMYSRWARASQVKAGLDRRDAEQWELENNISPDDARMMAEAAKPFTPRPITRTLRAPEFHDNSTLFAGRK